MIRIKKVAGPNPYVAGTGAQVTFGEFEKINSLIVECDNTDELGAADTAYALRASFTGLTCKALVAALSTVGGPGNVWTELVAGNFSGRTFTFIADGE